MIRLSYVYLIGPLVKEKERHSARERGLVVYKRLPEGRAEPDLIRYRLLFTLFLVVCE